MIEKLIYNDSQPELLSKIASQMTLIESGSHIKSASQDSSIRSMLADLKPDKDHFMVHLVALGDEETYGWNRNGDSFPKEACRKYVDTFVKHGHFFREHKNQDPKFKIGNIKAAAYNERMGRIELIIHGDKNLCPDIYESVKQGKARSYSMSCLVPYDISSITQKKQATLADYDKYCRYQMNQYIPEFKKYAYVINTKPKWFDISDVAKPADRIAHYLDYIVDDSLTKAASYKNLLSAELAELFPLRKLDGIKLGCKSATYQNILIKLAKAENYINDIKGIDDLSDNCYQFVKHACTNAWDDSQLTDTQIQSLRQLKTGSLFSLLAKKAAFLPFETFCAIINNTKIADTVTNPVIKYAKNEELPNIFKVLSDTPENNMEELFECASDSDIATDPGATDEVDKIMEDVSEKFSIDEQPVKHRVIKITIVLGGKPKETKQASSTVLTNEQKIEAKTLASAYGYYKIATINKINELKGQNFVDYSRDLLIIKQHIN